jgi:hypothetical protein
MRQLTARNAFRDAVIDPATPAAVTAVVVVRIQ